MDISYIREFVMLAECRNFSEAAERLFISQSSLSKHIHALEKQLGTPLFNRTTRSIQLSEAGRLYLPYAQKLSALCMESDIALDDFKRRSATSLTIAVMQNPQYYDMARYITGFRQAYPELTFSMVEADEPVLYDMFQKKTVNIFPVYSNFSGAGDYTFMPMVESAVVVLLRRDHPWAAAGRVSLPRLGEERLLLPTRGGSLSTLIRQALRREGVAPQVVYEGSSIGCIDLVKAGMGVSLHAREFAAALAEDEDVCCVELEPAVTFSYGLGHRPPAELTHAEQLYLSYMKQFEKIIDERKRRQTSMGSKGGRNLDEKRYIAHIREDGKEQTVEEHLNSTAKLAAKFADAFGAAEAGRYEGLAHDIGKYSADFQRRILENGEPCDHATAGAIECARRGADWAACAVMGHHSGLPDVGNLRGDEPGAPTYYGRLKKGLAGKIPDYASHWPGEMQAPPALPGWGQDAITDSFLLRMLYSCLVDADYLDTERFMQGDTGRGDHDSIQTLEQRLSEYIVKEGWDRPKKELNQKRSAILRTCRETGEAPRGLYTLTVPTGGGKTVASLAFALRHAAKHGMDRVIYVVPYTSIIEQNADVFRGILGARNVLEHHAGSLVDMDENATPEQRRRMLAAENWDAPVVVTTAVRFFEAMYANRSSQCRRLHNLANSVLIFDEAQMLPVEHLRPCVAAIAHLVKDFRATAVLCTATQPALGGLFREFLPGTEIQELCPGISGLWQSFKRVTFRMAGHMDEQTLAEELAGKKQVLCIVNTRDMAKRIFDLLPEDGSYHLSTLMYPAHRRTVLEEIKERLGNGDPCRVVSTSLVEAGVDVDFPLVYREKAGLDSILQAAGRCNREGGRPVENSIVTVFESGRKTPPLFQSHVRAICEALADGADPDTPKAVERYFHSLFDLKGEQSMDRCGVLDAIQNGIEGCTMPFRTVAQSFHLIDNATKTIYIPKDEGAPLTERLLAGERSRALYRQAGQYSVSVYEQHFKALAGVLTVLDADSAVLRDPSLYSELTGLSMEGDWGKALFG